MLLIVAMLSGCKGDEPQGYEDDYDVNYPLTWTIDNQNPSSINVEDGGKACYIVSSNNNDGIIEFKCNENLGDFMSARVMDEDYKTLAVYHKKSPLIEMKHGPLNYSCDWCNIDVDKSFVTVKFMPHEKGYNANSKLHIFIIHYANYYFNFTLQPSDIQSNNE